MKAINEMKNKQTGQSAIEMLIVLPLLLILIFGIIQWGFILRTKITLNTATELASRAGALNHGSRGEINLALAKGLVPLFMQAKTGKAAIVSAYARARTAVGLRATLTILNPSNVVWNSFKKKVKYPLSNMEVDEIINDNLMYRPATQKSLSGGVKMNIQDANLLKIKIDWCEELFVPVIGKIIADTASGFFNGALFAPSAEQVRCNAVGLGLNRPMLAMQSIATYRMQTPFRNR